MLRLFQVGKGNEVKNTQQHYDRALCLLVRCCVEDGCNDKEREYGYIYDAQETHAKLLLCSPICQAAPVLIWRLSMTTVWPGITTGLNP
jgi:hypothetical protein